MGLFILDDRDSAITYSSDDWEEAGVEEEFNSTSTRTSVRGATANISFTGRGISVWGTLGHAGLGHTPLSTYILDSSPPKKYRGALSVTNDVENAYLYLDFVLITPIDSLTPPVLNHVRPTTPHWNWDWQTPLSAMMGGFVGGLVIAGCLVMIFLVGLHETRRVPSPRRTRCEGIVDIARPRAISIGHGLAVYRADSEGNYVALTQSEPPSPIGYLDEEFEFELPPPGEELPQYVR
ncbi:unnamed protein product [Cyclocybe aegerita]|uniref:Uncharacterized protein n=1 Tax=Cyclocybe aegerita TaxID=1973307 RepID=A0A8S0WBQ8_CYCAE|nr:unnamed protein product [Cyclocybe aegerita]